MLLYKNPIEINPEFKEMVTDISSPRGTRVVLHNNVPAFATRAKAVALKLCTNPQLKAIRLPGGETTTVCGVADTLRNKTLELASKHALGAIEEYIYVAGIDVSVPRWMWEPNSTPNVVAARVSCMPVLKLILTKMLTTDYNKCLVSELPSIDALSTAMASSSAIKDELIREKDKGVERIRNLLAELEETRNTLRNSLDPETLSKAAVEPLRRLTPSPYQYFTYENGVISGVSVPVISGRLPLGSLKVSYNIVHDSVDIYVPDDSGRNSFVHPHVSRSGNACLGNISSLVNPEFKAGRYYGGFLLLYNYIKAYNSADVYWNTRSYFEALRRETTGPIKATDLTLTTGIYLCHSCGNFQIERPCESCSTNSHCDCSEEDEVTCVDCDSVYCSYCYNECPECTEGGN